MATMNVSLPDHMKTCVEARAKGGQYSNVSDYVRDLIRKDLERQQAIGELQGMLEEGLRSGEPQAFDMAGFIDRKTRGQGE
ncbi:MAG: type II toxin-antitoxin system ParD family antitoxin [Roseovarius indicus]